MNEANQALAIVLVIVSSMCYSILAHYWSLRRTSYFRVKTKVKEKNGKYIVRFFLFPFWVSIREKQSVTISRATSVGDFGGEYMTPLIRYFSTKIEAEARAKEFSLQ